MSNSTCELEVDWQTFTIDNKVIGKGTSHFVGKFLDKRKFERHKTINALLINEGFKKSVNAGRTGFGATIYSNGTTNILCAEDREQKTVAPDYHVDLKEQKLLAMGPESMEILTKIKEYYEGQNKKCEDECIVLSGETVALVIEMRARYANNHLFRSKVFSVGEVKKLAHA
jgi:hypothetical protein